VNAASEVAFLSRALKAPRIRETAASLAVRAKEEGWDYEAYLAAVLSEEVNAGDPRRKQPGALRPLPQVKTLDDFDFSFQRSVKQDQIRHLAQLDFLREKSNVIFLGPPEPARPIFPSPLGAGSPAGISGALCHSPGVGGTPRPGQTARQAR